MDAEDETTRMADRDGARIRDQIRETCGDREQRIRANRRRGADYGTVYYSNAFEERGTATGRLRIGTFGETDVPAVIVVRETRRSLFHLEDVERIDYHPPDAE